MADINSTKVIIILNVNGLNNPIKKKRLSNGIKRTRSNDML